ncbi:acyltransferase family protein [Planctomicrobium sp. SH661]|uniref:acyltransferase family protein n=1 Tax=Planctomicrobium sp. SH661 TaxID=3448124 RepID=UPI003F5B748F
MSIVQEPQPAEISACSATLSPRPKSLATFNLSVAGFGIFLVALGHSKGVLPQREAELFETVPAYAAFLCVIGWIYSFHMPLFMFLSGWNYQEFSKRKQRSYRELVIDKSLRLLVPYFVISSLAYPVKVILSSFANRPIAPSITSYIKQLLIPWDNTIIGSSGR